MLSREGNRSPQRDGSVTRWHRKRWLEPRGCPSGPCGLCQFPSFGLCFQEGLETAS